MKRLLGILLVLVVALSLTGIGIPPPVLAQDAPWPMFRHDPRHTGRSPHTGPEFACEKWSFPTGDRVRSCPAIGGDGTIYVGSQDKNLYAINPDGSPKWSFPTGCLRSSPAIGGDGTIYIGSTDNNLYAINPDGSLKWSYTTGNWVDSSPAVGGDGTIYVGSDDNKLYAINPNGSFKWSYTTGGPVESSPAIGGDGTIYVGSSDNKLYAINPDTYTPDWSYTTGSDVDSSPAVGGDGTIYVGSYDHNLYAINPDTGTLKWSYTTDYYVTSSPAIGGDGTIYVGSCDNKLYAINPDGSLKWSYTTGSAVFSSPAVGGDGTIYVGSFDDNLYAINPDGTEKWRFNTGYNVESSPAIGGDGTIYVGSRGNNLSAIGAPALQVIKTGPAEARHGDQVTYNIKVCNVSETDAVSVTLTDILPNGLYYVSSNPSGIHKHGTVTWGLGEIAPSNCRSVYLTATVDCSLPDQAIVYDTASVVWKDPCQNDYGPSTDVARTRVKKQYIKKPLAKPPAERPARFLATYPHIVPTRVLPNQPVNVLLNVKNVAASGGYYNAVLYIDGEMEDTQTAYISPGQTQRLVFTVYRETPGKYWAAVGGYGAWFTVAEAAEVAEYEVVTSPPPPSGGLGTPALLAIILGSVGVGVAIFFATRPRVT